MKKNGPKLTIFRDISSAKSRNPVVFAVRDRDLARYPQRGTLSIT